MKTYKFLIVTNAYAYTEQMSNQVERLSEEFLKLGYKADHINNLKLYAYIENDSVKVNLPKYDFVVYLDKDKYLSQMLEKSGYKLFNSAKAIDDCDDKMITNLILSNHGIKMPKTISAPLCYVLNEDTSSFIDQVVSNLTFPIIVKENFGSGGKQVYFANNKDELMKIEKKIYNIPHIFQEYITSSYGFDYRLIVIGGKTVAIMKRESNEFRSNLASGGNAIKVNDLDQSYIDVANKCAKILNLDFAGVDLLKGPNNEPIVCEVNSNAGLIGIEKTSGINVAKIYAEYIIKTIS